MLADVGVLWQLLRGSRGGGSHSEKLERFYSGQAEAYDRFRERLLHGRGECLAALPLNPGGRLVELGGGTGRNLEFLDARLPTLASATIVDLCPSLLTQARARCARQGWTNVECIEADATTWRPSEPVDAVLMSYSLTMIPDWAGALANALAMLRPGGHLAVVDFTVFRAEEQPGRAWQPSPARFFWRHWFGHDGVRLNDEHQRLLRQRTVMVAAHEGFGSVPYLPLRAPYYWYVGMVP